MLVFPATHRCIFLITLVIAAAGVPLAAQGTPADSTFRRAKRLVAEGHGTAGRAIVDSMLRAAPEGTPAHGDALYWRGALAETAADAERDYRRVIVEYPLSPYADNALLAMADLERARGDRAGALEHLQRFVREHPPTAPARGAAALTAARLAFDQRDNKIGCAMIVAARASTPAGNVEARNQIEYLATRCSAAELAGVAPVAVIPAPPPQSSPTQTPRAPVKESVPAPATDSGSSRKPAVSRERETPAAPPSARTSPGRSGNFTIQLAAYNTRADADRMVAKLKARGVVARVSGDAKPFRVRLDFFPTRQAAQAEVDGLRARGIVGFVTTEDPPASHTP